MAELPGDLYIQKSYDDKWLLLDECTRLVELTEDDLLQGCEHVLRRVAFAIDAAHRRGSKAGRAALQHELRQLLGGPQ